MGLDAGTSVELVVDGVSMNYPVNFGGSALVWGKSILARNYSGTTGHLGQWVSLDPSMLQKIDIAWSIFPQTSHETAVARLDASRDFIVFLSQDVAAGDCTGARVKPIVDDKPIPDETGADLFLYPNGSIIAIGKTVRLSVEGTCKPGKSLNGAVRLL